MAVADIWRNTRVSVQWQFRDLESGSERDDIRTSVRSGNLGQNEPNTALLPSDDNRDAFSVTIASPSASQPAEPFQKRATATT